MAGESTPQELARALQRLEDQDRQLTQLKLLFSVSRELSLLHDPQRILETFLLMTHGALGISQSFVLLFGPDSGRPQLATKGFDDVNERELLAHADVIFDHGIGNSCSNIIGRVEIVPAKAEQGAAFPDSVTRLFRWCEARNYAGVWGFGDHGDHSGGGPEGEEFVSRLGAVLVASLRQAFAAQVVERLYAEQEQSNKELRAANAMSKAVQRDLDRQVFHLNSLYETTRELAGIVETKGVLETFLLTVMGVLGASGGGIYLHDDDNPLWAVRGSEGGEQETSATARELERLGQFFKSETTIDPPPMSVQVLKGEKVLAGACCPFEAHVAVHFAVDAGTRGLLVLGARFNGDPYRMEEQKILKAHLGGFMAFLKNARYFEEVNALNESLIQRNAELNRLLEEISQCKLELSDVELAKERILAVMRRETSRSNRVRRTDFFLIFILAFVIGLMFNFSNPNGIPLLERALSGPEIEAVDALRVHAAREQDKYIVVDARPAEFYKRSHVLGSVNLPRALFGFVYSMRFASLDPETKIVVYGRTISRWYDADVARMLRERGFENVFVLSGGLPQWEELGYPVERR